MPGDAIFCLEIRSAAKRGREAKNIDVKEEFYTAIDDNALHYEATIEDPKVFSRPWKMSMPLYRRRDANMQLMEYKCVPFTEELLYGKFRKKLTGTP